MCGDAQRVPPHRITETIHAGQHQKIMLDGHLIDRLLTTRVLRARLRMVVAASAVVIGVWDVDPREPWPDGRDYTQDQAVSD